MENLFYILIIGIPCYLIIVFLSNRKKLNVNYHTFFILGLTLFMILFYTRDTHRLANYTSKIYFSPRVISNLSVISQNDTLIRSAIKYQNLTEFYIDVYTKITVHCFDDTIQMPDYTLKGKTARKLPPLLTRSGSFWIHDNKIRKTHRKIRQLKESKSNRALILEVDLTFKNDERYCTSIKTLYSYNFDTNSWDEYIDDLKESMNDLRKY
ncbi:hypothetical protein JW948_11585 [bacterium]|nr:hypothetical protein [bacterium]